MKWPTKKKKTAGRPGAGHESVGLMDDFSDDEENQRQNLKDVKVLAASEPPQSHASLLAPARTEHGLHSLGRLP